MSESTWRDRAPAMLRETFTGPNGEPCFTAVDRRWLWRIEGFLAVAGTTEYHRQMQRDLRAYLNETCDHHWSVYPGDAQIAPHRQCIWCSEVEWDDTPTVRYTHEEGL